MAIAARRACQLNLSDIPEMLPGARPGANPAQREQFEGESCRLHQEELEQEEANLWDACDVGFAVMELEVMFPTIDGALIHALYAEAPSVQHAINALLELSASSCGEMDATRKVQKDVGIEDHNKFPLLIDADGWQVPSSSLRNEEGDLGSSWCDHAKASADKPAPKSSTQPMAWGTKKKAARQKVEDAEQLEPYTDYECRHQAGERRAKQRVQYSRRSGANSSVPSTDSRQHLRVVHCEEELHPLDVC